MQAREDEFRNLEHGKKSQYKYKMIDYTILI